MVQFYAFFDGSFTFALVIVMLLSLLYFEKILHTSRQVSIDRVECIDHGCQCHCLCQSLCNLHYSRNVSVSLPAFEDNAATVIDPQGGPLGTPDPAPPAEAEAGIAVVTDMEVNEAPAEHAGEVEAAGSPGKICVICRGPLRQPGMELQALVCGHVWHKICLENAWTIGGHERGWCPYRCDVRHIAAEFELPPAAGEVDVEEAAHDVEAEPPREPVSASPVLGPAVGEAASMVL